MKNVITTCCPSANELVELHHPEMAQYLAPVFSPMIAHGKMLHEQLGDNIRVVFIGPCIAKKKEAEIDSRTSGYVDAVIDFVELESWLAESNVELRNVSHPVWITVIPKLIGFILSVVVLYLPLMQPLESTHIKQSQYMDWKIALPCWKAWKMANWIHCVVEMSVCRGSCIEGPAIAHHKYSRFRKKLIVEDIVAGESEQPKDFPEKPNGYFSREFHDRSITVPMPTEAEIREILRKIGKNSEKMN